MPEALPNSASTSSRPIGHLLEFLAPGLVHSLGNSLFAIRGAAHVLGFADRDPVRSQRVVIQATEQAEVLLEILRYLSGVDPARPREQPGVLLERLLRVLRIPLRDGGLRLEVAHGSHETPVSVDACVFTRTVCEVVAALDRALPRGLEGRIVLNLVKQGKGDVQVDTVIEADASFLPFPLDVATVVDAVRAPLARDGVTIERRSALAFSFVTER